MEIQIEPIDVPVHTQQSMAKLSYKQNTMLAPECAIILIDFLKWLPVMCK